MNQLAQLLDDKLRALDPRRAQYLASLVRDALKRVEQEPWDEPSADWPAGYFESTAGVLAGEEFERPPQGELPTRDHW